MKTYNLKNMIRGWFVGNFNPSTYKTQEVEVAVKRYEAGEKEAKHVHKIATEITVVVSGLVKMNGNEYGADSIIVLSPGEVADFKAVDETITVVVKLPSSEGDKYDIDIT